MPGKYTRPYTRTSFCGAVSGRGKGQHNHEDDHDRQHGHGVMSTAGRRRVALRMAAGGRDRVRVAPFLGHNTLRTCRDLFALPSCCESYGAIRRDTPRRAGRDKLGGVVTVVWFPNGAENFKKAVRHGHDGQTVQDGSPLWTLCEPCDLSCPSIPLTEQPALAPSCVEPRQNPA